MIPGGYYLKSRSILDSEAAHFPPHAREIWDLLLAMANHKDQKSSGLVIKRGQCFTSYREIRDKLHWMVGYRKETYSKWQCESAMKLLTRATMITTTKTTRGMIITVCNYDHYQNPASYESHNESHTRTTTEPQPPDTINKNVKNVKNVSIVEIIKFLNKLSGKNYKTGSAKTRALIVARENEGFTTDDFKKVIQKKVNEWKGSDMETYLRPETLFGTKFESYLNQPEKIHKGYAPSKPTIERVNSYWNR